MRKRFLFPVCIFPLITTGFVTMAQPSSPASQNNSYRTGLLSVSYFIESANNSLNSLNSLLRKDNYRNRISRLNNPVNNELGFNLKNEILIALKPIMDKTKKTDTKKFREVIENFLSNPEDNGMKTAKKLMPTLGIFSTVLSLVGNLVITERSITKEDLNKFIARIETYFAQYAKLNEINESFSLKVQELLTRTESARDDLKEFLIECITTLRPTLQNANMNELQLEILLQRHYDPQKLMVWMDTAQLSNSELFPPDAATSVKTITSVIKKLQTEFESIYNENYRELKELIASLKTTVSNLDQVQLAKTSADLDQLYTESRQADVVNLNISVVQERMNTVCRLINRNF